MAPGRIKVTAFEDYEAKLRAAKVILDPQARADAIWHDATNLAFAAGLRGGRGQGPSGRGRGACGMARGADGRDRGGFPRPAARGASDLDEGTSEILFGPQPCQRADRALRHCCQSAETTDHGATILAGNQKVLSARLSDAKFFWDNDLRVAKAGMDDWTEALKSGDLRAAPRLRRGPRRTDRGPVGRDRAADRRRPRTGAHGRAHRQGRTSIPRWCSSFPSFRAPWAATMPRRRGIRPRSPPWRQEHYQPLGPSDAVPTAPLSVAVALAEKIDTLTGFWAIDEKPTGSKDPFALRRAALGVIRILVDNHLRLRLYPLIDRQIVRHKITIHRPRAGDGVIDTLEEIVDEIAHHGRVRIGLSRGASTDCGKPARRTTSATVRSCTRWASGCRTCRRTCWPSSTTVSRWHLRAEEIGHDVIRRRAVEAAGR